MDEEDQVHTWHAFHAPLSGSIVSLGFSFKNPPLEHSGVGFGDAAAQPLSLQSHRRGLPSWADRTRHSPSPRSTVFTTRGPSPLPLDLGVQPPGHVLTGPVFPLRPISPHRRPLRTPTRICANAIIFPKLKSSLNL